MIIFLYIFIFLLILLIFKITIVDKVHIDFKSFFRRGFKKEDNQFRALVLYWKTTEDGKTYSCIRYMIMQKLMYNYTIITNVKSFNPFKDTIYETDILKIFRYVINQLDMYPDKRFLIFFDEIFTILEKKTAINKEILSFISQLRKRKILFVTTAQEWSEINITFRRYVRYQIDCHMFALPFTHTAYIFNSVNDGDQIKWDNDLQEFIAPRISANFAKCNKDIIMSYDTFETIST